MTDSERPRAGERLIRVREVLEKVGLGKTTVYALIKAGEFPQPRKVGHASLWVESEIEGWVRNVAEQVNG